MNKTSNPVVTYIRQSLGIDQGKEPMRKQTMFSHLTWIQTLALIISNIAVSVFIPVFGGKEFTVLGAPITLAVTGAIFFFPITCIVDDLQTEIFGRKNNLAMLVSYGALWLVTGVFFLISKFTPDPSSSTLPDLWTAAVPSTTAFLVSSIIDSEILLYLKRRWPKNVIVRFVGSTAVGQLFDTLIFTLVAVWTGLFPDWRLGWALFPIEYVSKLLYETLMSPAILKLKNYIEERCED